MFSLHNSSLLCSGLQHLPVQILIMEAREQQQTCSKLIKNTPERRHVFRSGVFIVNFHTFISHLYFTPCSNVSVVGFEQINAGWVPA